MLITHADQVHLSNRCVSFAQLRLTPDQLESKRALEAAVQEVKDELEVEEDASKKDALNVELKEREGKLDGLMESFEVPGCLL